MSCTAYLDKHVRKGITETVTSSFSANRLHCMLMTRPVAASVQGKLGLTTGMNVSTLNITT